MDKNLLQSMWERVSNRFKRWNKERKESRMNNKYMKKFGYNNEMRYDKNGDVL